MPQPGETPPTEHAQGTAASLYDDVLSDEEKQDLAKQAKQQVDDVEATLVREHFMISQRSLQTDADKARLAEIDQILAERRAQRG